MWDLRELGLDSAAAIDMLVDLEQSLGFIFPDSALNDTTFRTAATLEHVIRGLVEAR